MFSFTKRKREPGWLAVCPQEAGVQFAQVVRETGSPPVLRQWFFEPLPEASAVKEEPLLACLGAAVKTHELKRYTCTTLMKSGEYQFIQVEAPPVPDAEMKEALRWKLKDLVELPTDDVTFDLLPIPDGGAANRPHQLYLAIAAKPLVLPVVQRFESADLYLAAIDLPELAQRNVAALFETENRGLAFLAFSATSALLTFTFRGELFAFRRIEIGAEQICFADPERRAALSERLMLEIQRSIDAVDRQFSAISLARMIIALPPHSGLEEDFRNSLYIPFETMDLTTVMDLSAFPELAADTEAQRLALPAIGAALRHEEAVAA